MATYFEAQIDIDADVSVVWQVLTDLARYGDWNTFCFKVESTLQVGKPAVLHVQMSKRFRWVQREIVRVVEPDSKLCWDMKAGHPAIMNAARWQVLEPLEGGRCRYKTWERFQGLLAPAIGAVFGGAVQRGFEQTARDLKARAEQLAQPANQARRSFGP